MTGATRVAAAAVTGASAAWLLAARRAGLLPATTGPACTTGDPGVEPWSRRKRRLDLGWTRVAYVDEGEGDPVLLLHGCPFHAVEWRELIPRLAGRHRVIAPDLIGLGDTEVDLDDDYRLPRDVDMVIGLLDALGLDAVHLVGHDHGGATALLLTEHHAHRLASLTLTNIEAYDGWPSQPERKYLRAVVNPVTSPLFRLALNIPAVRRDVFSIAVHDPAVLADDLLTAFVRPHTSTAPRWQRLRRFFRWQLDPDHNRVTVDIVDSIRRFQRPTLILWGRHDTNFGAPLAERLATDIPGTVGIRWLEHSAHLPMLEEPDTYAQALEEFWATHAATSPG